MQSVKKSFFWSGIEQLGPRIVTISVFVVMARLLEPRAFGLIGMLALFMGVAGEFTDSGLSSALIQRKTLAADDETSVFALNIAAGLVLAALLCLVSPLVARFYNQPLLIPLLCVNSLTIVISSFGIVQAALMSRNMQFHNTAVISTTSSISAGIIGIIMATLGYGVWSLVGSGVAAGIVRTGMYWKMSTWRPRGKIRLECVRSLWGFSSRLLCCGLIRVAYENIYNVIIGKIYSPESLGYYNRADSLRMFPASLVAGIVSRVSFPLFSRDQDNKPLLLKHLRQIVRITLVVSASGLTLLAVIADPLIPLLLTEKWRPAVPLLRILCYAGVLTPVHVLYLMTLMAQGHSRLNLRLDIIKCVYEGIVIALVYKYGLNALAWSVVGLTVIAYFLNAWYNVKLLGYRWRSQAFDILPTLSLCYISGWTSWYIGTTVSFGALMTLCLQSVTFTVFVGLGIFLFRKIFFADVWKHLTWGFGWLRSGASVSLL
jgi:O-antigen/teichoic acid export membrane protein